MISVYTKNKSKRLTYTVEFIFRDIAQIPYQICTDDSSLTDHVINYSDEELPINCYQISPSGLLFSKDHINPHADSDLAYFCLFRMKNGHHPFDVFSAIFYLISRMEEYDSSQSDIHGRFVANQSILVKEKQQFKPVVDQWVFRLLEHVNHHFNSNYKITRNFKQYCTIDIDNAYAFKHKGILRTTAGTLKDGLTKPTKLKQRWGTYMRNSKDPYDTYSYIQHFSKNQKLEVLFFFLLGDYAQYDKNIRFDHPKMISLIKQLGNTSTIGIHPSYASYKNSNMIGIEKQRLEHILGKSVHHNRFHFLKFSLPKSYQQLLAYGISNDYSMGYADQIGFRAGTCTPFNFYDLENEVQTDLKVHPFAYMDGVLNDHLKLNTEMALDKVQILRKNVAEVKGTFTSIWHNESLSNVDRWSGWQEVFEGSWKL